MTGREAGDKVASQGTTDRWGRAEHSATENSEGSLRMAAMKPRTGDGPLEAAKEGRGIVVRIPIEGGGRLVVELTPDEAAALGEELRGVTG